MSFKNLTGPQAALILGALVCLTIAVVEVANAGGEDIERPAAVEDGTYVGADTCKKCHFKSYKSWKDDAHAKAFEQLPEKHQANETCLACHTTGHGQPGGFVSLAETDHMVGVQCEMCHGPGGEHVEFATANKDKKDDPEVVAKLHELIGRQRAQSVCYRCHRDQTHGEHPEIPE